MKHGMQDSPFMKIVNKIRGTKEVPGAALASPTEDKTAKRVTMVILAIVFFIFIWIFLNFCKSIALQYQMIRRFGGNILTNTPSYHVALKQAIDIFHHSVNHKYLIFALVGSIAFSFGLTKKMNFMNKRVAYGQKGDARFTTEEELEQQYTRIPDHDRR